jgi:hypothetical protein
MLRSWFVELIGNAGTRFPSIDPISSEPGWLNASQGAPGLIAHLSPDWIGAPVGERPHFLAIHQPNLAENMI